MDSIIVCSMKLKIKIAHVRVYRVKPDTRILMESYDTRIGSIALNEERI